MVRKLAVVEVSTVDSPALELLVRLLLGETTETNVEVYHAATPTTVHLARGDLL